MNQKYIFITIIKLLFMRITTIICWLVPIAALYHAFVAVEWNLWDFLLISSTRSWKICWKMIHLHIYDDTLDFSNEIDTHALSCISQKFIISLVDKFHHRHSEYFFLLKLIGKRVRKFKMIPQDFAASMCLILV